MWSRSKNKQNEQWFESLVHRHSDELTAFAFRMCGNRELAEDLMQESFSEAWKSIANLREIENTRAWLYRVLRRRYARTVRNSLTRPQLVPVDSPEVDFIESIPSRDPGPYIRAASSDYLQKILSSLDERFRIPLLMATMEGLTTAQISKELGIPVGTVLTRIHRARRALQDIVLELDPPDNAPAQILKIDTSPQERKLHGY